MRGKYGGQPTTTEWSDIMDEDDRVCWSSTQLQVLDATQLSDPYKIECPASQASELKSPSFNSQSSSQETQLSGTEGMSPPLL